MATQTIERPLQPAADDARVLFPGRYLSVTSFKRDGTGVATPVWFVSDGMQFFAVTDAHSGKVRRIRRNPHVLIAPCRADGKLRAHAGPGARGDPRPPPRTSSACRGSCGSATRSRIPS